jgi:hypothetical protein
MKGAPEMPHSKYPGVYAIIRLDLDTSAEDAATVVKGIPQEIAGKEAARLKQVNKGSGAFTGCRRRGRES